MEFGSGENMNEKFYTRNFPTCQPYQYKPIDDNPQYYSYTNFPLSPDVTIMDYNTDSQNFNFQQNQNCTATQVQDNNSHLLTRECTIPNVDKVSGILEKVDMIEISNKDLSPTNYCTTMDMIIPDTYKQNINSDLNNFNDWHYENNDKNNMEYAPCAHEKYRQINNFHKNVDFELMTCNNIFQNNTNIPYKNNENVFSEISPSYMYNYNRFTKTQTCYQNGPCFNENAERYLESALNTSYQQMEHSSEESDIIVEESDEEVVDSNQENGKKLLCKLNKCLICNTIYKPLGTQFYFLTVKTPLTMSSQKPVSQKLENIIGKMSTVNKYLCGECLELINTIDHLQHRLKTVQVELIRRYRKTCLENNICYEKPVIKSKRYSFTKPTKYKCKLCKKVLCLKKYYVYHLNQHKNAGYLCDFCGKTFSNRSRFIIHRKQHNKLCQKISGYHCSNCSKVFRTNSNKTEHENYCLGTLPFECTHQHCGKKFSSATKLKNHIKLKHDKKFMVICSICNTGFIKTSDYKNHMISHSAEKKYQCSKCDKSYKTLSNLKFHMKIHTDNLPFNCHICKKGFMRKDYLEVHVNNHNGIKNFQCTYSSCGKKFVSQKNLDAHLKYHEGTVKKNTCHICGKVISTRFEEHLRVHNNFKEFDCEYCHMKFNTKGTLSKHIKKKHFLPCI